MNDACFRQHFATIDSTQLEARRSLGSLPLDRWVLFSADEQTMGRGTNERSWFSPQGMNLYATFALPFPAQASEKLFFLSQIASLAVARVVQELGIEPQLKWPNDLMIHRKKVSGVLVEAIRSDRDPEWYHVLLGIGLNVNMGLNMCEKIDQPSTSLSIELGQSLDLEPILISLSKKLQYAVSQLLKEGFPSFHEEVQSLLAFQKSRVRLIRDHAPPMEGIFFGIDAMGRALLQMEDGTLFATSDGRLMALK